MKVPNQNIDDEFSANRILEKEIKELKAVYARSIATRDFEITQLQNRNNYFIIFQGVMLSGVLTASASKPFVEFIVCLFCIIFSIYQTNIAAGAKYWQEYWELKTSNSEKKLREKFDSYMGIYKNELIAKLENKINYLNVLGEMYQNKIENLENEIDKIRNGKYLFHHLFEFLEDDSKEKISIQESVIGRVTLNEKDFDYIKKDTVNVFDIFSNYLILKKFSVSRIPIIVGMFFTLLWFALLLHTLSFNAHALKIKGFTLEPNTHSIVDGDKYKPIKIEVVQE